MKVIITGSAADGPELARRVRSKQALHELKARAKNPDDPLELVIVRDMWLTGFDSPAMHTMYVDKPIRGAGLMQASTLVISGAALPAATTPALGRLAGPHRHHDGLLGLVELHALHDDLHQPEQPSP